MGDVDRPGSGSIVYRQTPVKLNEFRPMNTSSSRDDCGDDSFHNLIDGEASVTKIFRFLWDGFCGEEFDPQGVNEDSGDELNEAVGTISNLIAHKTR